MSQKLAGGADFLAGGRGTTLARARSGAVALEFAILAIPFFLWMLFIFEMSYDLFVQEALDYAVHRAVRQIQTGDTASSVVSGKTFIANVLCGATKGLLECNNLWLRVTQITGPDFAPPTTSGALPVTAGALDLSEYTNMAGANAGSTNPDPPYCEAAGKQPILVSVIYIGPSFVSALLPGAISVSFAGQSVHATMSTAGFITEAYTGSAGGTGGAPAC